MIIKMKPKKDWMRLSRKWRIHRAINLLIRFGDLDGQQHKQWVLDQVLRVLMNYYAYQKFREAYPDWDEGIAP